MLTPDDVAVLDDFDIDLMVSPIYGPSEPSGIIDKIIGFLKALFHGAHLYLTNKTKRAA